MAYMSDKASTMSSLQAIRAKLQQLQMQQPQKQQTQQSGRSKEQDAEASHSNSFNTPSSTQHSEADLSIHNTTATTSLHLPDRLKIPSHPERVESSGFPTLPSSTSWQGSHRLNDNSSNNVILNSSLTFGRKATVGPTLNSSINRTADLTDLSLSSSSHITDALSHHGREMEADKFSHKSMKKEDSPDAVFSHFGKASESSLSSLHCFQDQKPQESRLLKRTTNQNTEDFDFKVPKPASGYTDSQMEIGPSAANRSRDERSLTSEMPLLTHPSSASKNSMRHFISTPDMHTSARKLPSSQLRISSNLGKPMRVRMQQHPVHLLSEEKEDDTDLINSVKPFNPSSHVTTGRFASLASSGYHSDMTITTENSIPDPPSSSQHRNLILKPWPAAAESKPPSKPVERKEHTPHAHPQAPSGPPSSHRLGPVVSTPVGKAPPVHPSILHTPAGDNLESVTVNGEQYCVLKKVGRGGSAQVYRVLDANKDIRALKVVDLEGAGPEVVDGFRNEIRLLQRLQYCSSVIKMFNFELNQAQNCLYVLLEYGETDLSGYFTERAKHSQGLTPTLVKFYWQEMLQAVNALHKEGVIHSDLKPANFMLVSGNLKLIDFGIANTLQQDKTSVFKDSRVGTPSYMSPEAIMAACDDNDDDSFYDDNDDGDSMGGKENQTRPKYKVGVRSDVWSLGCILYNMVYGRTPFQHIKNNMAKLQAITNPAVPIKFPDLPHPDPHLLSVLQNCLQREVKLRPTTEELLAHPYLMNKEKEESRRLQELLKTQLAEGSPGTARAVSRVLGMLQKQELGQH